jgi:aspartyl-tRNA(Asn)/glutamyl-tRNA(Gln) amidotransferase subunit A
LRGTRAAIEKGELSPKVCVDRAIAQIEQNEPRLNALVTVLADQARERAQDMERNWSKFRHLKLAGVPLIIKDNMLLEGAKTTCASKILHNFVSPYTATAVQKLSDQGAIIVGKANMDEFAMGSSNEHSAYGPVKNPWNTACVSGGSSGGSAVSVAAGYVTGSLGSDTGGSIRQPAALCGLTGFKPTYGRISRYGLVAFASSLDQIGPFGWTSYDCALLTEVMAGFDPNDQTTARKEVPPFSSILDGVASKGYPKMKLGVPRGFFSEGLDSDVRVAVEKSLETLKKQGHTLVDVELPNFSYAIAVYYIVATSEASSNLARFDGVRYGHRTQVAESIQDLYRRTRSEGFGREVKFRIMLGNFSLSSGYYDAYYRKATQMRAVLANDFKKAFQSCDVVLTPTSPSVAFRFGERTSDPLKMYLSDIFTVSINLTGNCAMSVPCGFNPSGLPVGLQMIAPPFEDQRLFTLASHFQKETDFHLKRPGAKGGRS